jgi:hypothetical protein
VRGFRSYALAAEGGRLPLDDALKMVVRGADKEDRAGRTMVWPVYGGHPDAWIRCFMPSSAASLAYAGYFKVCR